MDFEKGVIVIIYTSPKGLKINTDKLYEVLTSYMKY